MIERGTVQSDSEDLPGRITSLMPHKIGISTPQFKTHSTNGLTKTLAWSLKIISTHKFCQQNNKRHMAQVPIKIPHIK